MPRHRRVRPARLPQSRLRRSGLDWALLWMMATIPMAAIAADARQPLSRLLPARGLVFYLEYDGLGAHAEAWKSTAACEILRQRSAGDMITDVARQALDRLLKIVPDNPMTGNDLVGLQEHVVQHGMALSCYDEKGRTSTVIVLDRVQGGDVPGRVDRLLRFVLQIKADAKRPSPARVRGRELHRFGLADPGIAAPAGPDEAPGRLADFLKDPGGFNTPKTPVTWWLEADSLILVVGPSFELAEIMTKPQETSKEIGALHQARVAALIATIEHEEADARAHPVHALAAAEGREIDGFEADGLFFAMSRKGGGVLGELRNRLRPASGPSGAQGDEFTVAESLGLDRATQIVGRWGFRGKALLTDVRFLNPGPMTGMAGLFDRAGLPKDRLPPIPRTMGTFAFGSFRRGDVRLAIEPLLGMLKSEYADHRESAEQVLRDAIGPQLGAELFRHLGPTWCIYASPGGPGGLSGPAVPTVLAAVDDPDAFGTVLDRAATRVNDHFRKRAGGGERPALAVERMPAPARGYWLVSPAGSVPWLTDALRPTILAGKSYVAIAANPELARRAIAAEDEPAACWKPTGELLKVFEALPARVSFLRVGNPRDSSWPEAIAHLPETAGPFLEAFVGADLGRFAASEPSLPG